jgi:hypothetical protein
MPSKRQTTMAKIAREQAVRERRARKQEKKDNKKAAAAFSAHAASTLQEQTVEDEIGKD